MDKSIKYTEEQGRYFEGIIQDVSQHKDFGKRNPVDIGIECGYPEDVMLELIQMLYSQKKYYFIAKKQDHYYLVSVNRANWSVTVIKEVDWFWADDVKIKDNIMAHLCKRNKLFLTGNKIKWENIESGKKGEFFSPVSLSTMILTDGGIIAFGDSTVVKFHFDGSKLEQKNLRELSRGGVQAEFLVENDGKIYLVERHSIWCIDKDFQKPKKLYEWNLNKPEVIAAECYKGKFYYYLYDEKKMECDKYYEGVKVGKDKYLSNHIMRSEPGSAHYGEVVEIISTENCKLIKNRIYARKLGLIVDLGSEGVAKNNWLRNKGVTGIFSEDIFIGVKGKDYYDDNIVKIDLKNERKPVVLPIK